MLPVVEDSAPLFGVREVQCHLKLLRVLRLELPAPKITSQIKSKRPEIENEHSARLLPPLEMGFRQLFNSSPGRERFCTYSRSKFIIGLGRAAVWTQGGRATFYCTDQKRLNQRYAVAKERFEFAWGKYLRFEPKWLPVLPAGRRSQGTCLAKRLTLRGDFPSVRQPPPVPSRGRPASVPFRSDS